MTSNDDEPRLSSDDERFVRRLDALYQPPEPTAAVRARFAARLHERMARRRARARWQLAGATAAVAVFALVVAQLPGVTSGPAEPSGTALASAGEPSTEETLLFLANGPLADPDEALPDDYRTLASLLE